MSTMVKNNNKQHFDIIEKFNNFKRVNLKEVYDTLSENKMKKIISNNFYDKCYMIVNNFEKINIVDILKIDLNFEPIIKMFFSYFYKIDRREINPEVIYKKNEFFDDVFIDNEILKIFFFSILNEILTLELIQNNKLKKESIDKYMTQKNLNNFNILSNDDLIKTLLDTKKLKISDKDWNHFIHYLYFMIFLNFFNKNELKEDVISTFESVSSFNFKFESNFMEQFLKILYTVCNKIYNDYNKKQNFKTHRSSLNIYDNTVIDAIKHIIQPKFNPQEFNFNESFTLIEN